MLWAISTDRQMYTSRLAPQLQTNSWLLLWWPVNQVRLAWNREKEGCSGPWKGPSPTIHAETREFSVSEDVRWA